MDLKKLTEETILKNMTPEQQKAVLDSVMASVQESKKVRSQKVAENIDLVMQALQKIEAKMLARVDGAASKVEQVAANVKDGKDGRDGKDGKPGKDGAIGPKGADGRNGKDGKDGKDGRDGVDGVSVVNAFLDFDNSLVIELSNGKQINVGGVLSNETADKVRVVANGGGTSQGVLDALAALQTEIDNLIPSQTGNAGKFLSTNGSTLSWVVGGGGLSYQGTWNASTNTPTLASGTGTNGYYYIVSVSGSTNLDGITNWVAGDWLLFNGTNWQKIDQSWAQSGANSDITSMSGITGAISTVDYVGFDTAYSTTLAAGQLGWDGNNTLGLGMAGGNVIQHIGEDQFFYCKASSTITKGQVVMFTGAVGASGVVTGAPATGVTDGTYIMGVAAESIALNGFGLVQCFGILQNINTSGFADGDILWYDPANTGGLTKTKPSAPNIKVQVAAVTKGGSTGGGSIMIRVNPGSQLGGTDSNAQITSVANGNLLTYDGGNGYWKNTDLAAGTGISVSKSTNGVLTVTNSAPDQTVALTGGTGITTSGTYPNFTITNSAPMAYPGSGIPNSTGSSWGTSYSTSGTGTTVALTNNPTFAGVTNSGNLTFTGTSNRITGDFSNATLANRVAFQSSTTNGETSLVVIPNGTSTTTRIQLGDASNLSGSGNFLNLFNTGSEVSIRAGSYSGGAGLPMTFYTSGSERMRISTTGYFQIPAGTNNMYMGAASTIIGGSANDYGMVLGGSTGNLILGAGSVERMRIDSSGNVGIGRTPIANTTTSIFQVSTGILNGSNNGVFGNLYFDTGSSSWKYAGNGYGGYVKTSGSSTPLEFGFASTNNAGGAGAVASVSVGMVMDTSGNVGIGTSSPSSYGGKLVVASGIVSTANTGNANITGSQFDYDGTGGRYFAYNATGSYQIFYTNASGGNVTERMRIDSSGNLLVGGTSVVYYSHVLSTFNGVSQFGFVSNETSGNSNSGFHGFTVNGTAIGSITRNGTANSVLFNTTSDQRLKENIADADAALDVVGAIKVRKYDWKEGGQHEDFGFIAQEIAQVVNNVVSKGRTEEDMWSLDYGKLTPLLVKAIQEQQALITQLTERISALENK